MDYFDDIYVSLEYCNYVRSEDIRKVVLLIGASYSAMPIAELIHALGFKLLVLTGKPEEPATYFAEEVIKVDYSNHEESMKAVEQHQFDFVVPSCNDAAYLLGAKIATKYHLPGFDVYETCLLISSKSDFRQLTSSIGIPAPRALLLKDLEEGSKNFPIIVKPNLSFSGRGISVVKKPSDLMESIQKAKESSTDNNFAIESFIEGSLHSISGFIQDGKLEANLVVDEFCTVYPFQVNNSNFPSTLSLEIRNKAMTHLIALISNIKFVDGLVHLQFIVKDNEVYFIELMRRCPGDLFGHLFRYSMGFDYYNSYLTSFLDNQNKTDSIESSRNPTYVARTTESSQESRIFLSITAGTAGATIFPVAKSGEKILPAPFGKTAIAFFKLKDKASLDAIRPNFDRYLSVTSLRTGE